MRARVYLAFEAEAAVEYAAVAARLRRLSTRRRATHTAWEEDSDRVCELSWEGRRARSGLLNGGAYVRSARVCSSGLKEVGRRWWGEEFGYSAIQFVHVLCVHVRIFVCVVKLLL